MKQIDVVAAIIIHGNDILCVKRDANKYDYISYKYEFPGGKIEVGESNEEALKREISEELNMDIKVEDAFITVNHTYPDFILDMHSYKCSCETRELTLMEHIDYKWLIKDELLQLDWAAADIPIVKKLMHD